MIGSCEVLLSENTSTRLILSEKVISSKRMPHSISQLCYIQGQSLAGNGICDSRIRCLSNTNENNIEQLQSQVLQ